MKAQYNLGNLYSGGEGVAKDEFEAVKWYRRGAELGEAKAQFALGRMYSDGRGITKDKQEAVKWYQKAAAQGDEGARKRLERLEDAMTAVQGK